VAVDATGLAPGTISTFYVRRTQNRGSEPMLWRRWLISGSSWSTLIGRWCSGARGGLLCGPYNGSAMLFAHLWMAPMRLLSAWGMVLWRMQSSTERAQPPPRARTARCNERGYQPSVARRRGRFSRSPGQDASCLPKVPNSVVPKAGAGGERLLSCKAQTLGKSTGSKPRNAADAGTAARARLQPLPAQTLPSLK
jgi:hypothetical protein